MIMFNFHNKKSTRWIASAIIVILVIAMIVPTILSVLY